MCDTYYIENRLILLEKAGISNITADAQTKIVAGLKEEAAAKEYIDNKFITDQNISDFLSKVLFVIDDTYKQIDPTGNLDFDSLFTKRDETYSGSETTMFHLAKLYSICKVADHPFPIIVDSFRAEDLSTPKEAIVLDLYKQLSNQIIFTTTLKAQEVGKYTFFMEAVLIHRVQLSFVRHTRNDDINACNLIIR